MQNNAWKRLLALTTAAVLSLSGCQKAPPAPTASPLAAEEHRDNTFFAMDTVMSFTVYGPHAEEALAAATDRVNSLERLLSVTLEDSEVWKLNHAEGESVRISPETNALLRSGAGGDHRRRPGYHHVPRFEDMGLHHRRLPRPLRG